MQSDSVENFRNSLSGFSTAVLVTRGTESSFHARPMAVAKAEGSTLWFISGRDSAKVHEIESDSEVLVVCQDGWATCVTMAGTATLVHDRAKILELWKPAYNVWFPGGAEDPDIVLIRVDGDQGEYWDNSGTNRFVYAFQALKALVTKSPPEVKEGVQHDTVTL